MALLLLVGVGVILTGLVAVGVSRQSHAWADALVNWLKNFPVIGTPIALVVGALLVNGADWISNRLAHVWLGVETKVVNWVGGLAHYVSLTSQFLYSWPIDLITFARWLVGSEIPRLVHSLPNSLTGAFSSAVRWLRSLEHRISRLAANAPALILHIARAVVTAALAPFLIPLHWLHKEWRVIAKAAVAAGGIAIPWIWVPRLRRDVINLRKELSKVRGLLGVTGFALIMSRVLRVTPRCLTNGNIGKISRRLCGLGPQAFDDLLGLIADFFILQNICEVVTVMEDALQLVFPEVAAFIATAESQFIHCGYDLPDNGTVAAPDTPPVTGLTLSLA